MVNPAGKIRSQSDGVSKTEGERYPMRAFQPDTDGSSSELPFYRKQGPDGKLICAPQSRICYKLEKEGIRPVSAARAELAGLTLAGSGVNIECFYCIKTNFDEKSRFLRQTEKGTKRQPSTPYRR